MELLQLVSRSYWPPFYFICLCLHFTMYLLIYYRTSRLFTTLRRFLYPANTANFVLATAAFVTQVRNANNKQSMALLCDGFCKFIGPSFCFNSYVLLLVMITVAGFINLHTLCYRTMCLKYFDSRKSNRQTMKFTCHYSIPILVYVLTYIPPQNHAEVYKETLSLHPTYQLDIYKVFGGFANSHHICMTVNTLACATATLYVPIIGSYWKHVAMKILNSTISSSISSQTRLMLKTLIKGLNFQVILPLACYVPVTFMYCWNKYSGDQILISQYTLAFMGTLPCIFDPLLQMYFILPYRTTVQKFISCVSFKPNNPHIASSIPRRSFLTP